MIRKAKVKTVFEVLQYTGNNQEEMDEFACLKAKHDTETGALIYTFPDVEYHIDIGDYLSKELGMEGDIFISGITIEFFNFAFEFLPLPIEEKIMTEFNAKEEM